MDARIIAAALVLTGLAANAAWPRYEWRDPGGPDAFAYVRVDRWTGRAEWGHFYNDGEWRKAQKQAAAPVTGRPRTPEEEEFQRVIEEADQVLRESAGAK